MIKLWDPFKEVVRIERDIEDSYKKFFHHNEKYFINTRGFMKALSSFRDKGKEFEVEIRLSGVEKKDITLKAHHRVLEINAEKSHKMEVNKKGFFSKSRSFGKYYKVIPLPNGADIDRLRSEFNKETLRIVIPKKKVLEKHRVIKIH